MNKAMYPGSFDPITKGHVDIISRASKNFDELEVVIMHNPKKKCTFTVEERLEMLKKCVKDFPNVKVSIGEGLTVQYAKKLGCNALIRGIRAVSDYEYELAQATTNMNLDSSIETYFLVSKPEYSFLSSSVTKEIAYFNGDISNCVPECIINDVEKKLNRND